MNDIIISVKDLCKCFGNFTAVDHITFEVRRGEIFGFLGANGAGKTTAMRMLCGLSYPTSGSGTVAGFDVMTQGEQIKRHIGYMSQRFSLYDDLTVRENIRLYAGIYGLSRYETMRRTVTVLNRLRFRSEADTLVGALPLGWKQKLAFSVATLHRPEVVFLDEPTGGVDPVTRRVCHHALHGRGGVLLAGVDYGRRQNRSVGCSGRVEEPIRGRIDGRGIQDSGSGS